MIGRWLDWLTRPVIPIEESTQDGYYVVRAEVPGLDPALELGVMVADNEVTIEMRRPVRLPGGAENDFHDPAVRRTVRLPAGAKDDTVTATYGGDGILEVRAELTRPAGIGRVVPITERGATDAGPGGSPPPARRRAVRPRREPAAGRRSAAG